MIPPSQFFLSQPTRGRFLGKGEYKTKTKKKLKNYYVFSTHELWKRKIVQECGSAGESDHLWSSPSIKFCLLLSPTTEIPNRAHNKKIYFPDKVSRVHVFWRVAFISFPFQNFSLSLQKLFYIPFSPIFKTEWIKLKKKLYGEVEK